MPPAPAGFEWQPCIYQFDQFNTPALANIALLPGQTSGNIPLKLDRDASFVLLACKVQNGGVNVLLSDPWSNNLMDDFLVPALFAGELSPWTVLEGPGLAVPAGAVFQVRLQGA